MKAPSVGPIALGLLLGVLAVVASPATRPAQAQEVILGTGAIGTVEHQVGRAICHHFSRKYPDMPCAVLPREGDTSDAQFAIDNVSGGAVEFGLASADWYRHAVQGSGPFEFVSGGYENLRSVFSLHWQVLTIVAGAGANISSLSDLAGRRVNIGAPGSETRKIADALLSSQGWDRRSFSLVGELPATQTSLAFCHGRYEAAIYFGASPNESVDQLLEHCDAVLVPLEDEAVSALTKAAPDLIPTAIAAEQYKHLYKPVSTVGRPVVLFTSEEIDAQTVYRLVKVVFDGMERFKRIHPALRRLEPESMLRDGLVTPLHEGARRYVLENGIM